jgi:hypothetical protein
MGGGTMTDGDMLKLGHVFAEGAVALAWPAVAFYAIYKFRRRTKSPNREQRTNEDCKHDCKHGPEIEARFW